MTIPQQYQKGWKPPFQQQESVPGSQFKLDPPPLDDITADGKHYKAAGKLEGRTALITGEIISQQRARILICNSGADSGIGRAIALLFGN
jgi:hypothetical protein